LASAIDAHTARIHFGIDERSREAEVGAKKRGRVAAGPAADNSKLCGRHMSVPGPRKHEDSKNARRLFVQEVLRGVSCFRVFVVTAGFYTRGVFSLEVRAE